MDRDIKSKSHVEPSLNIAPSQPRKFDMKTLILVVALLFTSAAHAGSYRIHYTDPADVVNYSNEQLCDIYNDTSNENVLAELKSRDFLTGTDWSNISQGRIQLSMSYTALICSWGYPSSSNKSVGPWGVHLQLVYGDSRIIYIENGYVTSWQSY